MSANTRTPKINCMYRNQELMIWKEASVIEGNSYGTISPITLERPTLLEISKGVSISYALITMVTMVTRISWFVSAGRCLKEFPRFSQGGNDFETTSTASRPCTQLWLRAFAVLFHKPESKSISSVYLGLRSKWWAIWRNTVSNTKWKRNREYCLDYNI